MQLFYPNKIIFISFSDTSITSRKKDKDKVKNKKQTTHLE